MSLCDALCDLVKGKKVHAYPGDWMVSNIHDDEAFAMYYKNNLAIYGFKICSEPNVFKLCLEGEIVFHNYHRHAEIGNGTPSLKEIEEALKCVAKRFSKRVIIRFDTFGQISTRDWMAKNGYVEKLRRGLYQKVLV